MKKILGLAVGLLLTAMTFAQSGVTFSDATDGYDKTAVSSFHFDFDTNYTVEDITKAASYYTNFFTVETAETDGGVNVTINLVDDNDMSRRVVPRFFISLEVETINVNGTEIAVDEFMSTYIMN